TYRIGVFLAGTTEPSAQGHFTHVYVSRDSRRSVPLPDSWRQKLETLAYPQTRARASVYSLVSRAISSAAGVTLSSTPIPWPDPQMSRHALAPVAAWKFIASGPGCGKLSGSSPAATIEARR